MDINNPFSTFPFISQKLITEKELHSKVLDTMSKIPIAITLNLPKNGRKACPERSRRASFSISILEIKSAL